MKERTLSTYAAMLIITVLGAGATMLIVSFASSPYVELGLVDADAYAAAAEIMP